jgi:hypothetical protein
MNMETGISKEPYGKLCPGNIHLAILQDSTSTDTFWNAESFLWERAASDLCSVVVY